MSRVIFPKDEQRVWLENILSRGETVTSLAQICQVSSRTIRDWKREKFTITLDSLSLLSKQFGKPIPQNIKIVGDYWYGLKGARNGGLRHVQLYGPPGNRESRSKGGLISQQKRRENPENYTNCSLPKIFETPLKNEQMAELVGIILGDGGLTHDQLKITLDRRKERLYTQFVIKLVYAVFNEKPSVHYQYGANINVCNLMITGINLIKLLGELGVPSRNKVIEQAGVPTWVANNFSLSKACLRGLVDTDGGIYFHHHVSNHRKSLNLGLCFSNKSQPLLEFVYQQLTLLGFTPARTSHGIYMYRASEVVEYANIVGFSNHHHTNRLRKFLKLKSDFGRSVAVAHRVRLESA